MNIFLLAEQQLKKEGLDTAKNAGSLLIDKAIKIRRKLDISDERREAAKKSWKNRS